MSDDYNLVIATDSNGKTLSARVPEDAKPGDYLVCDVNFKAETMTVRVRPADLETAEPSTPKPVGGETT